MDIPKFGIAPQVFYHTSDSGNPYRDISASVELTAPDGETTRTMPLFWDGGHTWRFRFSPDKVGRWTWRSESNDPGLADKVGAFDCVGSDLEGSIRPMAGYPHHFERQDESRFWFLGETAWSFYVDSETQGHDRAAAQHHIDVRAAQGFTVVHSMLLSELGWDNSGGPPFEDLASERINPGYWQEVDRRLAYLNSKSMVGGLVLAWARKRWRDPEAEPYAWDRFPSLAAQMRYARYIAARYSAYDVYFIVAGEWNASVGERPHDVVRQEYVEIGDALRASDPHERMMTIHPGTGGVYFVREFNAVADWMDFGDYQQNYTRLNAEAILSRPFGKPVVNGEYAYYLRDAAEDGVVDKPNSQTLETMRFATWDLVMGGAYVVSGFGSAYLGGARNPGPFDVDAPQNDDWEAQIQHVRALFTSLDYWRLMPRNDLVRSTVERGADREIDGRPAPPATTYWCLAEPGEQYVVYVRGLGEPATLTLDATPASYRVRQFDPRTGASDALSSIAYATSFSFHPPDARDWVVVLEREA